MASAEKRPKTVQQKLFFREGIISIGPKASDKALDENNNESLKSKSSEVTDRGSEVKKVVRKWNDKWLKLYSWLRTDVNEDGRFMYCEICTNGGKSNAMNISRHNTNFQNSTLSRHADLDEHKLMLQGPRLRQNTDRVFKKLDSKKDAAATVLLKLVHWLAVEDLPFTKYESLLKLLLNFNEEELNALKILKVPEDGKNQTELSDAEKQKSKESEKKIQYVSPTTSSGLLDSLASVVESDLTNKLNESPFVTALADESTDIVNHKRLVIYAQIIDKESMKPSTRFVANIECPDASGQGIGHAILQEFQKLGVEAEKIMSLGSDGASVMTGKKTGCAAIMKRQNPHMYNVHCVAHRLALCTSQAAENIPLLKQHQQVLTDLFYYFKGSAKRSGRLHEIQSLLDDPVLSIKEIHSVRWLSYFSALTTIYRTLDSLLAYLAERPLSDAKAMGLKKKISTETFLSITHLMMDAMAPVTVLSQFFQTENVDVALVKVKLDLCIKDLEMIKSMDTPHMKVLRTELPPECNLFKGHSITMTNLKLEKVATEFVDALIGNIKSRFPEDDILTSFSVLSMRPLTFLSDKQLEEYGVSEIETLCEYYGQQQTASWMEDGVEKKKVSQPLVDPVKTMDEWYLVKKVTKAEKYPRDKMSDLWWHINHYHREEFPNLVILATLALTCSVHTAGCERGFSVQNRILTTFRNRLTIDKQQKLMQIKIDGAERDAFDFPAALHNWKTCKDRRLYEISYFK